jgi:hypothetical protein
MGCESQPEGDGMRCLNCVTEKPEALKFCNKCAAPFKRPCGKFGTILSVATLLA